MSRFSVPRSTSSAWRVHRHPRSDVHDRRLAPHAFGNRAEKSTNPFVAVSLAFALSGVPDLTQVAWATELAPEPSSGHTAQLKYESVVRRRSAPTSESPTSEEAGALASFDKDLFTKDAWLGMLKIKEYTDYVDSLGDMEDSSGCEKCKENRMMLEKVWQAVANEFYDPTGRYSQADWAGRLEQTLKARGGALHTQAEAYNAAEELIDSLDDPWSAFLPPSRFRQALRRPLRAERDYLAAQYVGVGINLGPRGEVGRPIDAVLAGSTAEEAGVHRGDTLLELDGVPVHELSDRELAAMLRGPSGSSLLLTVRPADHPRTQFEYALERRFIPQPAVKQTTLPTSDGSGLISYIRAFYFSHATTVGISEALTRGEALGVSGYILDLRNNPGGVFEEAVAIADLLLDRHTAIAETVRNSDVIDSAFVTGELSKEVFPTQPAAALTDRPVVILTNSNSASAAEVLTGALHDNGRATVVGERTFGKGVVQYYFPMKDGSGLKLTVAKYLTPNRYDITKEGGIAPDRACSDHPRAFPGVGADLRLDGCMHTARDIIEAAASPVPAQ